MRYNSTYWSWRDMVRRCTNKKRKAYSHYGGRGIKVCEHWLKFEHFLEDMGECPEGLTIDRIDNDGDYEPGNCKWSTYKEQNRNRRDTRLLTHKGKTMCMTAWAEEIGMGKTTLWRRLKRNWSVEKALTTPVRRLT